jgi:DNA replication protein DnaC
LTTHADNVEERLNDDQRNAYKTILNVVTNKEGKSIFVYGSGGTGKTFVWTTLLSHLQGQGKIVLEVASSMFELHLCCFWATKSPIQDSRF